MERRSIRKETEELLHAPWRDLHLWYRFTDDDGWTVRGSRKALLDFAASLKGYAADPHKTEITSHEHFPPFFYLAVVTWRRSEITPDGIFGTLREIAHLAERISSNVTRAAIGDCIEISHAYSPRSTVPFTLQVAEDSFDPAAYEREIVAREGASSELG